jgi:regulatory protein
LPPNKNSLVITAIKAQVKNQNRVSVYVNGAYAFSLTPSQLLEQKIHGGLALTEARLAELKKASEFGKAFERTLNFVMIRTRSTREVRDYFWRKKIVPEDGEVILQKLTARGYVNDANFARAWVQQRQLTKARSRRQLTAELKQKGVNDATIAAALQTQDYDEHAALRELIAKKRKITRYQDPQKLKQYLARQGFGFDDISAVLAED